MFAEVGGVLVGDNWEEERRVQIGGSERVNVNGNRATYVCNVVSGEEDLSYWLS